MKKIALFGLGLLGNCLLAQMEVVFMEVKDQQGKPVVLEADFPYAHVALFRDGRYLHAHPKTGVAWATEEEIITWGEPRVRVFLGDKIIRIPEEWLGRGYDSGFSWDNERFYCSELVAKILGISPEPMHFDPDLWPPSFEKLEGLPGISPGKIYKKVTEGLFSF